MENRMEALLQREDLRLHLWSQVSSISLELMGWGFEFQASLMFSKF